MRALRTAVVLAVVAAGCGTSVETKRKAMGLALNEEPTRGEFFEATLRELDAHPEYVDQFFQVALNHRPTLERFIANTVAHLHEKELAALTASYLAKDPDALYTILVQTLDHVDQRASQKAIASAIEDRAELSAQAIATRPSAIRTVTLSMVDVVANNPEGRDAFRAAMKQRKQQLAQIIATDPETLSGMVDDLMALASKEPEIAKRLIGRTVQWLDGDVLADTTAAQLTQNPRVMKKVLLSTLDQIGDEPQAQQALLEAVRTKRKVMVKLLASDPATAFAIAAEVAELGVENSMLAEQLQRLLRRAERESGVGGSGKRE